MFLGWKGSIKKVAIFSHLNFYTAHQPQQCCDHQLRHYASENTYTISSDNGPSAAFERAKMSLLQYNIMIDRGIKPDVLTFTSLIDIMGRAKLEWQAYRLFSSMLEMGLTPLPQTYVALKLATKPTRRKLLNDLDARIVESASESPNQLAEEAARELAEEDTERQEEFERYFRTSEEEGLPVIKDGGSDDGIWGPSFQANHETTASSSLQEGKDGVGEHDEKEGTIGHDPSLFFDDEGDGVNATGTKRKDADLSATKPYATVHIYHPIEAWEMHKQQGLKKQMANTEEKFALRERLGKMHESELRTFLAIHRQFRDGTNKELKERVLNSVPLVAIETMLRRRNHYFRSVERICKIMLEGSNQEPHESQQDDEQNYLFNGNKEKTLEESSRSDTHDNSLSSNNDSYADCLEHTHTTADAQIESDVVYTPWGVLRRPPRVPVPSTPLIVPVPPPQELIDQVVSAVTSGSTDSLAQRVMRDYAAGFGLPWRRTLPDSLRSIVTWHVNEILPFAMEGKPPPATLSARLRAMSQQDSQSSLEAYEALRIISLRTRNLQITDGKAETGASVTAADRLSTRVARKFEDMQRREANIMQAELLKKKATEWRQPFDYSVLKTMWTKGGKSGDILLNNGVDQKSNVLGMGIGGSEEEGAERKRTNKTEIRGEWKEGNFSSIANSAFSSTVGAAPGEADDIVSLRQRMPYKRTMELAYELIKQKENKITQKENGPDSHQRNRASSSNKEDNKPFPFNRSMLSNSPLQEKTVHELPPWELGQHSNLFNIDSGHFGNPTLGRYTELADGNVRVMPQHESLYSYSVSPHLLPAEDQMPVNKHRAYKDVEENVENAKFGERMRHASYRRFVTFQNRVLRREIEEKQKKSAVSPRKKPQRLSYFLRAGKDYKPLMQDEIYNNTKPL